MVMIFYNKIRRDIYYFLEDIYNTYSFDDIKNYLLKLKQHISYDGYFNLVVESIKPKGPETDKHLERQCVTIGASLARMAGVYYACKLSNKKKERFGIIDIEEPERLFQEFSKHILFGEPVTQAITFKDIAIEQRGLVPLMTEIAEQYPTDAERKTALMPYLADYKELVDQERAEAEARRPEIFAKYHAVNIHTEANKHIPPVNSNNQQQAEETTHVEKLKTKSDKAKKSVSFSI